MSHLWMLAALAAGPGRADEGATLVVNVTGVDTTRIGVLRCALFDAAGGFPTDSSRRLQGVTTSLDEPTCEFRVPPGTYAVAVAHDENGDERVSTNPLGIPTEGWGTSRNARPPFRAPRFEESAVVVAAPRMTIGIRLRY